MIKGKIHINEQECYLSINGIKKFCPFSGPETRESSLAACGPWCALFGEPREEWKVAEVVDDLSVPGPRPNPAYKTGRTILELCHKTLIFDEFVDERER